jgi:hypothetical protein
MVLPVDSRQQVRQCSYSPVYDQSRQTRGALFHPAGDLGSALTQETISTERVVPE